MKQESPAHFNLVKLQNRKMIRNLLRAESPQGIPGLAVNAGLSYPTVSSMLKELMSRGEVIMTQELESSGGRPGARYELNASYQYALVIYLKDWTLQGLVLNAYGSIIARKMSKISKETGVEDVLSFVKQVKKEFPELSTVLLGIPGVARDSEITFLPKFSKLEGKKLAEKMQEIFRIDLLIENDMNVLVLAEIGKWESFAHIAYINECIGVGIVMEDKVIKGSHGYAGELEYLCDDMKDQEKTFVQSILALICVLDLPDIVISADQCTEEIGYEIRQKLKQILPENRIPNIHIAGDMDRLYEQGLKKRILLKWSEEE